MTRDSRVPDYRIPLSPPRSLNCREIPPHLTPKHAKHAHFSRYLPDKADWRERTARHRRRSPSWRFSGWHIGSPVSTTPPGECNAITNRSFGESRVDFFVQHPVGTRLTEINTDRVWLHGMPPPFTSYTQAAGLVKGGGPPISNPKVRVADDPGVGSGSEHRWLAPQV
jgi:hypothetical protein